MAVIGRLLWRTKISLAILEDLSLVWKEVSRSPLYSVDADRYLNLRKPCSDRLVDDSMSVSTTLGTELVRGLSAEKHGSMLGNQSIDCKQVR